jgi:hypothetical protein
VSARYAVVRVPDTDTGSETLRVVRRYLPSNYAADAWLAPGGRVILIHGEDSAGWTLDGYVIPRLASGMIYATERPGDFPVAQA